MKTGIKHCALLMTLMIAVSACGAPANDIDEPEADDTGPKPTIAIIGTGDMGDSLGPRFAELGYPVVYGSRTPGSEKARNLVLQTGGNARVTTQMEAAQAGDIVVLAVIWPPMETVAQNLGSLMVPLIQRRAAAWEPYFRRSYFWECIWIDEYSEPVSDANNLAEFPETQGPAKDCPGT